MGLWSIMVATLTALLAMAAQAQNPPVCETAFDSDAVLAVESFADGLVTLQPAAPNPTEIDLMYYRESDGCEPLAIDQYGIEGGEPRLEDAFLHHHEGWPVLVTIVSWPHEHRGLGMTGRYYAVHVYQQEGATVQLKPALARQNWLSGVVGTTEEWQPSTFAGTTRLGATALLASLAPPSEQEQGWQELCNPQGNQMEITACVIVAYGEAQRALNAMLVRISKSYADAPQLLNALAKAQNGWQAQAEADLSYLFPVEPGENPQVLYGSSYTMQHTLAHAHLVRQRTDYLSEFWLPMDARRD